MASPPDEGPPGPPAGAEPQDLQCPICLEFFHEPLTLGCKHSFCRLCLLQSTKLAPDGRSCPLCREVITNVQAPLTHPADPALEAKLLDSGLVPTEAREERAKRDADLLADIQSSKQKSLPVFGMRGVQQQVGGQVRLFLFEPRYRILIRRVWEGERTFVCFDGPKPREGASGLLVKVRQARFEADGKASIEGVGVELATLGRCWVEDGTAGLWYTDVTLFSRTGPGGGAEGPTGSGRTPEESRRRPGSATGVARRLRQAISEGAPAYNAGDAAFCARRYIREAREVMAALPPPSDRELTRAVRLAEQELTSGSADEAAWRMRRQFDAILEGISSGSGAWGADGDRGQGIQAVANGDQDTPSGWLPIFCYAGLELPAGPSATFQLFEPRYRTLAREVSEAEEPPGGQGGLFLCANAAVPRAGQRATLVRLERCQWSGETAQVRLRKLRQVGLGEVYVDEAKDGLWYGRVAEDVGQQRGLPRGPKAGKCCAVM